MTKKNKLPKVQEVRREAVKLPFNSSVLRRDNFVFSFAYLDRTHKLFNLGADRAQPKNMPEGWYLSLLDALKVICAKNINDLKDRPFEYHSVRWEHTNATKPENFQQHEFHQMRVSKSKGRIIGFSLPMQDVTVFFIVWLDPHHNLTDSEGYGKAVKYAQPMTAYEILEKENEKLRQEIAELKTKLSTQGHSTGL